MRKLLRKLLEILDGTPAVYGKKQRGQSVVELALLSPLLVILVAGLAEIGYFARNYIIVMEVARVGARTGTVQDGERSPLRWDNAGSIVRSRPDDNASQAEKNAYNEWIGTYRYCGSDYPGTKIGFYNYLACIMQASMDPLAFRENRAPTDDWPDEIVISAFAIQAITPSQVPEPMRSQIDWPMNDPSLLIEGAVPSATTPQLVVVGRYPTNANECNYDADGSVNMNRERDPFDYIRNDGDLDFVRLDADGRLTTDPNGQRSNLELSTVVSGNPVLYGYDTMPERQRGFVWYGRHSIPNSGCIGSEWSLKDVERLINSQAFSQGDTRTRSVIPSQGLVLVEVFWRHETLSQFVGLAPLISPVFSILGNDTTIAAWAAFPLSSVEPRIKFPK
ncbi:MAG: TadE/TadG family type IV pilus assembly protein [Aggregatilineales bacterium]